MRLLGIAALTVLGIGSLLTLNGCVSVPSGTDAGEAATITDALERRYQFRVMSKIVPTKPAVGTRPGVTESYVTIIGVIDPAEQDKVVVILRDIRATLAKKPISVRFYREEELTVTHTDPVTGRVLGWHREDVDLLREVRIE